MIMMHGINGTNGTLQLRSHEGRVFWFNTMLFTKADLQRTVYHDTKKLSRRYIGSSCLSLIDH